MERLEAVQLTDVTSSERAEKETNQHPALSAVLAELSRDPVRRWAMGLSALCVVFVVSLAATAYFIAPRLIELTRAVNSQVREAESWAQQTAALKTETVALKNEVEALRQYISSASSEDVIFLKIMFMKPKLDEALARKIARAVHQYSELHGKDPNLVLALISVESDFNPKAVSSVGAVGLMQVMPQWKKVLGIQGDLDDVETSVRYGLQILGFYTEMYKDLEMALTAYNRGPGPVDSALMKGRDPKNGYPAQVLKAYQRLKMLSVTFSAH
jgi:soluble lytic murein transglycosylase-like protein